MPTLKVVISFQGGGGVRSFRATGMERLKDHAFGPVQKAGLVAVAGFLLLHRPLK